VEVVASLSQGRTATAQCGFFTYKSVPVIFEPPCSYHDTTYDAAHDIRCSTRFHAFTVILTDRLYDASHIWPSAVICINIQVLTTTVAQMMVVVLGFYTMQ